MISVTAVTALYDVGRAGIDGRSVHEYVRWLNETLRIPLPFIVFLAPDFDASEVQLKPGDKIVRVAKADFATFAQRDTIEQIIRTSETVNRRDIAFKLPEYGMLVMSKPEMMKRAAAETDADALIWIDAGLCRFLPDLTGAEPVITAKEFGNMSIGMNITNHLSQHIRLKKLPHRMVGTTLALMSAGDFIIARDYAQEASDLFDMMVQKEWLPEGKWDNEQVALGTMVFRGAFPDVGILSTTIGWANVSRWLFGLPIHNRKIPLYVRWRFLVDEIRTRRTPKDECYLPGDFPSFKSQQPTQTTENSQLKGRFLASGGASFLPTEAGD